ncbi:Qat anti-phage system ATPase QatA [Mesorhizobium sp. M00.F.Ca.ET.217.01.1.1]|uniref:Qat anti-phage system ATPase QatA n=1 Tax=Mesorhizobium sp. M00.F.Ca.ET.217.01.1.1 TaxID=2500529 RepID=UPI000FD82586|nr:Qat anti-phage system ATPase QatA [Mesorhizobium sp. M00.F.Ca.ET.217.01.1.1]TGQ13579.1 NTPase KAP [Mesorhizobium sp. M00.F.Ca.ET.217.01.1.1]TGV85443.1 NTPase KAP [Mesorhizobium sp. M00.F.Ca.ET.158.01.1.1]
MIIADNETHIDYLYYEPIARTVVKLIREKSAEPLSIGLHGDWGAGKSSALLMIERAFAKQESTLCVRFNGWLFEGYDDAKAVLIETIVAELLKQRSAFEKVKEKAADVLQSINWFKVARTLGSAALTFYTGMPQGDVLQGVSKMAESVIADPQSVLTGEMFKKIFDGAQEHFKADKPEDTAPDRIHQFRRDFKDLLEVAKIDRLVVLVDDLDRCLPKTAIATLEAIRLFLFVPKASFVIAADEGMIEYAVRDHFPDLPASSGVNSYARSYLEKLIQVPFRMPPLGNLETRIYVTLLLYLNAGIDPSDKAFTDLLDVAEAALKRPWQEGFTREEITRKVGTVAAELELAIQVASEITPILTEGAHGNPRQIKRFVNTMALRLAIAVERGFGDDLKAPVLAKLMLAERFAPDIFEAIARDTGADGRSTTARQLEQDPVEAPETDAKPVSAKRPPGKSDAVEWPSRWAKIEPKLAEVDLRPYVFISRDRRAIFSAAPLAGTVENLVERLSGPKMAIRTIDPATIAGLSAAEADRVFAGLVAKINGVEDLTQNRPQAAEGLAFFTAHRPAMQAPLLEFLQRLPASKLGGWVLTGWAEAFDASMKPKFDALVRQWAEQTENPKLSSLAQVVSKPSKSKGRS